MDLLGLLVERQVRFVLVGGLAVGAWGHVRGTKDLDIVPDPDPENIDRLEMVLTELDGRVIVQDRQLAPPAIGTFLRAGDKTLVRTPLGDVDVLQGLPQIPRYAELVEAAVETDLDGVPVTVCSLEHLLAMKRAADRHLDRSDIEALEIAHADDSADE